MIPAFHGGAAGVCLVRVSGYEPGLFSVSCAGPVIGSC